MADYMAGINNLPCVCMKASFYPALILTELIVAGIDCFMAWWWWWGCAPLTQRHTSVLKYTPQGSLSLRNKGEKWGCGEVWRLHTPPYSSPEIMHQCTNIGIWQLQPVQHILPTWAPIWWGFTQLLFCITNINTLQMGANEPDTKLLCLVDQILISGQPLLLVISSKYEYMQRL